MNSSTLQRAPLLGIAGLVVIVDQASKQLASSQLADGRVIPLLPGLLNGQLTTPERLGCSEDPSNGFITSLAVTAALLIWACATAKRPSGRLAVQPLGGTLKWN